MGNRHLGIHSPETHNRFRQNLKDMTIIGHATIFENLVFVRLAGACSHINEVFILGVYFTFFHFLTLLLICADRNACGINIVTG